MLVNIVEEQTSKALVVEKLDSLYFYKFMTNVGHLSERFTLKTIYIVKLSYRVETEVLLNTGIYKIVFDEIA